MITAIINDDGIPVEKKNGLQVVMDRNYKDLTLATQAFTHFTITKTFSSATKRVQRACAANTEAKIALAQLIDIFTASGAELKIGAAPASGLERTLQGFLDRQQA